jgi:hypothetical protein
LQHAGHFSLEQLPLRSFGGDLHRVIVIHVGVLKTE